MNAAKHHCASSVTSTCVVACWVSSVGLTRDGTLKSGEYFPTSTFRKMVDSEVICGVQP